MYTRKKETLFLDSRLQSNCIVRAIKADLSRTATKKCLDNEHRAPQISTILFRHYLLPLGHFGRPLKMPVSFIVKGRRPSRSDFFISSSYRYLQLSPKHPASSFVLELFSDAILKLRTWEAIGRIQPFSIFFLHGRFYPTCKLRLRDRRNRLQPIKYINIY